MIQKRSTSQFDSHSYTWITLKIRKWTECQKVNNIPWMPRFPDWWDWVGWDPLLHLKTTNNGIWGSLGWYRLLAKFPLPMSSKMLGCHQNHQYKILSSPKHDPNLWKSRWNFQEGTATLNEICRCSLHLYPYSWKVSSYHHIHIHSLKG